MLLKYRSNVFVMEEEYRHEKNAGTVTIRTDAPNGSNNNSAEDDSQREEGAVSPSSSPEKVTTSDDEPTTNGDEDHDVDNDDDDDEEPERPLATPHIEKPEHTVDVAEAKAGGEEVSFVQLHVSYSGLRISRQPVPQTHPRITLHFKTRDCARDGWTTCLWYSMRI